MKIIGINGSPRKDWNTCLMVKEALKGAKSNGAETELVNLYDMSFQGCISCFACRKKDFIGPRRCALADDMLPVLSRILRCDGLVIGSPVYFGEVSSSTRAFFERLAYPCVTYRKEGGTFSDSRLPVLLIYTMNATEEQMKENDYDSRFAFYEKRFTSFLGGPVKTLAVTETLMTNDYSKYEMSMFDEAARKKRREEVFPLDLEKAFDMGADLLSVTC
ncbi:MAG: flavodoxin family protein [Treponema sp.]|jgi:multimeric flavodoxin WrbA|nr:flavodoxin family protein [Treponema sp.]